MSVGLTGKIDVGSVVSRENVPSNNLLVTLAERGVMVVLCGPNHAPAAWLWPIAGHHAQTERMMAQAGIGKPLAKRLWQALVVAKVMQQAAMLEAAGKTFGGVAALARKVRSGDPENIEAQAARRNCPGHRGRRIASFARATPPHSNRSAMLGVGFDGAVSPARRYSCLSLG